MINKNASPTRNIGGMDIFFSFIIIYSITMLNLLIAVLVDVVINQIFDLLINIMETPKIIIDPPI